MLGATIQKKRKQAGLTQAQLAGLLGVTPPAVNRWEKDLSVPDAALLAPLARCLKTDLNELFSFYDSLTPQERERILDKARQMLLLGESSQALSYIEGVVRENLSDGELYLGLGKALLGAHAFQKAAEPTIYLEKIAAFYERAAELLPEQADEISYTLITIYAALGDRERAEEAWARLPEKSFDKKWAHAEMLYQMKCYDAALPEIRRQVLEKIIGLSQNLIFFADALYLSGDKAGAEMAKQLEEKLRELFGLWRGIGAINKISSAIETGDGEGGELRLSELMAGDFSEDQMTTCPLFAGALPGGGQDAESTTGELLARVLAALQALPEK